VRDTPAPFSEHGAGCSAHPADSLGGLGDRDISGWPDLGHPWLLRPEAVEALRGSDFIVHAGDVGDAAILEHLARIAPVTAVRGNVDSGSWARVLPETAVLQVGEAFIYVLHDIAALDLDPTGRFHAVVYGHSHRPLKKSARVFSSSTQGVPVPGASACPFLRESYSFRVASHTAAVRAACFRPRLIRPCALSLIFRTFPGSEGQGIATEMARRLINTARQTDPEITVIAQTLPAANASTAILKKVGFDFSGAIMHPEDGEVWEWHLPPLG